MPISKEKLIKATREGKIVDKTSLAVFAQNDELRQEIDAKLADLEGKVNDAVAEAKATQVDLPKVLEAIKGQPGEKGDDGDTPTNEALIELIKPLIPEVQDGHTSTTEELTAIIKPLIPKAKEGYTPIKGVDYFDGEDAKPEDIVPLVLEKLPQPEPLDGSEIVEEINLLPTDSDISKIDFSHLKNVPDFTVRPNGGGWKNLFQMHDVLLVNPKANDNLVYNGSAWTNQPDASSLTLQTNGTPNGSQKLLNLVAGTNITLTDDGVGDITIAASGGGGSPPFTIASGDNLALNGSTAPAFGIDASGNSAVYNLNGTVGFTFDTSGQPIIKNNGGNAYFAFDGGDNPALYNTNGTIAFGIDGNVNPYLADAGGTTLLSYNTVNFALKVGAPLDMNGEPIYMNYSLNSVNIDMTSAGYINVNASGLLFPTGAILDGITAIYGYGSSIIYLVNPLTFTSTGGLQNDLGQTIFDNNGVLNMNDQPIQSVLNITSDNDMNLHTGGGTDNYTIYVHSVMDFTGVANGIVNLPKISSPSLLADGNYPVAGGLGNITIANGFISAIS